MNERLELFAKQADSYARYDHIYPEDLSEHYHMIFEAKFAELIIKECCKVIDDHYEPVYDGALIKKHFGVE